MSRDMTAAQFAAACQRHGFERAGFMGYFRLTKAGRGNVSVCALNAGERRRDQLAYLIRCAEREDRTAKAVQP